MKKDKKISDNRIKQIIRENLEIEGNHLKLDLQSILEEMLYLKLDENK